MDPPSSVRGKTPKSPRHQRKAKRLLALERALLAYPPSMLSPLFRQAIDRIADWSSLATKAMKMGSPAGEKILSSVPRRLTSMIEGLKKALSSEGIGRAPSPGGRAGDR